MSSLWRTFLNLTVCILLGFSLTLLPACSQEQKPLIVYAGKGLKKSMDEIRLTFENRYKIPVSIIYAGSDTLLTTIQKTQKGDIFIPGSVTYLNILKEQITSSRFVANHIPGFIVHPDHDNRLQTFDDLMQPGVRIAVGNKDMCAIGRVAEKIIVASKQQEVFRRNIVVTGSTVNELLNLVAKHEVDAALAWEDMLQWPEAVGLKLITIPDAINTPKEIRVAILSSSASPEQASLFADFVATEGQKVFAKHSFRVQ